MTIQDGFKIFTHDWRPPIQGGDSLLSDSTLLPYTLPVLATLDTSEEECGSSGYHYTASLAQAMSIAGIWRDGWSAKCTVVRGGLDAIQRGDKRRSTELSILRLCSPQEIRQAMRDLVPWAGDALEHLVAEQWAWYEALGHPYLQQEKVIAGLQAALTSRGLRDWTLQEYPDRKALLDVWCALYTRHVWDTWYAWDAQGTRHAWDAWHTLGTRGTRHPCARDTWYAWDARCARDAWFALLLQSEVSCGWIKNYDRDLLTRGIRDAYLYGLDLTVPMAPNVLGYCFISS